MSRTDQPRPRSEPLWSVRRLLTTCLATLALAGVAYLLTRHSEHALRFLPFLIVLACPLMHVLMHRGHRHP